MRNFFFIKARLHVQKARKVEMLFLAKYLLLKCIGHHDHAIKSLQHDQLWGFGWLHF